MKKNIEKQKLINLIVQGEAKNVKYIYEMPEVKEELNKIFGEAKGKEVYETLKELTKGLEVKDWTTDIRMTQQMMSNPGMPAAGLVSVEWE